MTDDLGFRVKTRTGTMLAKRRFYDDTYLTGQDGTTVLFICDAAVVEFPSGQVQVRSKRDVLEFPDEQSLLASVVAGGWVEAPVEGRWTPTRALIETEE